jgi:predicted permease
MRWIDALASSLRALFRRTRVEHDLDSELEFHLEQDIAERVAADERPEEARVQALRAFGGVAMIKDACRESLGLRLADAFRHDLRYTLRTLLHQPLFTLVVIASLALGIGANAAVFQLINAVRLRTLPVPDAEQLVAVTVARGHQGLGLTNGFNGDLTFPLWQQIRDHQQGFSGLFAWGTDQLTMGTGADTQLVDGLWVSGEAFPVLRLPAARGRLFSDADDRPGCGSGGAVLSYAFWQRQFSGDEAIVGKTLTILDRAVPVVGVAPKGFFGLEVGKSFDVALPICSEVSWRNAAMRRDVWWLTVMGRLKPAWSLASASDQLKGMSPGVFAATAPTGYDDYHDRTYRGLTLTAVPAANGSSQLRQSYDVALWLLLAMTTIVLLVACVNLANLMLARASARQREIAVRVAIGASRGRVLFQFLAEGMILSLAGGALGIALSTLLSRGLVDLLNTNFQPIVLDVPADWRVLAFTAATAMATCLLFTLVPAVRSLRVHPIAAMKAVGAGMSADREAFSARRVLVASQIALTLVLVAGSLLFVRSFRNLTTLDPGFRHADIVFMSINFRSWNVPPPARHQLQKQLLDEIRSGPAVASAALTTYFPLAGASWTLGIHVPNDRGEEVGDSKFTYVSPRYFETMGTPIVRGRDFTDFDRTDSEKVAIVNETFVRRYVRTQNPVGAWIRTIAEPGIPSEVYEIVGVARDTRYGSLREATPAMAFVPATQNPDDRPMALVAIRSSSGPDRLILELQSQFKRSHPDLVFRLLSFERHVQDSVSRERVMAWLAGFFGVLSGLLALVGLYGLVSYVVQRRVHEIGIRIALGASSAAVVSLVLRQTIVLVAVGLAAGVPASLMAARSASSLLFGLQAHDATTLVAATGLLTAIAAIASALPAWRAARIDPTRALRED